MADLVETIAGLLRHELGAEPDEHIARLAGRLAAAVEASAPSLEPLVRALGQQIDAQGSRGFLYQPQGPVDVNFGDQRNIDSGQYYEGPVINITLAPGTDPALVEHLARLLEPALAAQRLAGRAELRALAELVERSALPAAAVAVLYRASLPELWIETYGPQPNLDLMLADLARAPRPRGGVAPLARFAAALRAAVGDHDLQVRLQGWIDALAPRLGDPAATDPPAAPAAPTRPSLLVILRPDVNEPSQIQAALCLIGGHHPAGIYLHKDVGPRSIESVGPLIDERLLDLLDEDEDFPTHRLRFEFFLPRELLSRRVEELPVRQGSTSQPIGLAYPVVIRSLERAFERSMRTTWSTWRAKWERRGAPQGAAQRRPYVLWPSPDLPDLWAALTEETTVSLALVQAPPPHIPADDPLRRAWDAGVPIALWPDCAPEEGFNLSQAIDALLAAIAPDELPEKMLELRRAGGGPSGAPFLGRALRLLWDDPGRLPPDARRRERTVP